MWETKRRTVHFKLTFTEVLHFDVRAVVAPDVSPLGASSHAQADAFVLGTGRRTGRLQPQPTVKPYLIMYKII